MQASVAPGYARKRRTVEQHLRNQEIAAVGCLRIWCVVHFCCQVFTKPRLRLLSVRASDFRLHGLLKQPEPYGERCLRLHLLSLNR